MPVVIRMQAYPERMQTIINAKKAKIVDYETKIKFAGEMAADFMRNCISDDIKRQPSTGTLANSIKVTEENLPNMYKVSVGKLDELPIYWYVINYGKKLDGSLFIPGGGKVVSGDFGGERPDSNYQGEAGGAGVRMNYPGKFGVKAYKAVEGKGFVEKTKNWLATNIVSLLKGI